MITEAAVLESRFMNGAAVLDMIEGTYGKATLETKIYSSPWVSNPSITSCTGFIKGFGVHRPDSGSQVGLKVFNSEITTTLGRKLGRPPAILQLPRKDQRALVNVMDSGHTVIFWEREYRGGKCMHNKLTLPTF